MANISKLQQQANKAPQFVLKMEGLDLFVSNQQELTGCNITNNVNDAMKFAVGFDNEKMKIGIWTATAQRMTNNTSVKFEVMYLPTVEEYKGYFLHIGKVIENPNGQKSQCVLIYDSEDCIDATFADLEFENAVLKAKTKIDKF